MAIGKKKKHVSKKNKKDWRKHCDIGDVEDFLEDQRLEERLGKFETKSDSELFVIDTGNDAKNEEQEAKPLTSKQKKRALLSQSPKCFEVLQPSSKVQDPNTKRNHVNPFGTKPTALSKITESRKNKKGVYEKKLEQARINRKLAYDKKKKLKQKKQNFDLDLWGNQLLEEKGIPESLCEEFVSEEARRHHVLPRRRERARPPAPATLARPAVLAPHPGVSYNPSFQEHQALLAEVVQHEQREMKREAHLLRVTNQMFSKCTPAEKQNQWIVEMSAGLPSPAAPSAPADSESEGEYRALNPPVRNKKKDHKARRKQRERLEEKERLKRAKIEKKKISDIYRLRKIQSGIAEREQSAARSRAAQRSAAGRRRAAAPPALSRHRPARAQPDCVPPDALPGGLRRATNHVNPLRERFEALQRRGALAASSLMMKKKQRLKAYFKPGHKVTDAEVDRYMARLVPSQA